MVTAAQAPSLPGDTSTATSAAPGPSAAVTAVIAASSSNTGSQAKNAGSGDRASVGADVLGIAAPTSASAAAQAQSVKSITQTPIQAGVSAPAGNVSFGVSAGASPAAAVPMQDMIEAIRATIEIAARGGAAQARIALQPEELGHISIRLSQTSSGLLARVTADTAAGAQALSESRSELHQSLSSLNLPLLRLDISSFGQPQPENREGGLTGWAAQSNSTSRSSDGDDS